MKRMVTLARRMVMRVRRSTAWDSLSVIRLKFCRVVLAVVMRCIGHVRLQITRGSGEAGEDRPGRQELLFHRDILGFR